MGVRTGVPFPVMSRISFGIEGAHVSSLLRGWVAIVSATVGLVILPWNQTFTSAGGEPIAVAGTHRPTP